MLTPIATTTAELVEIQSTPHNPQTLQQAMDYCTEFLDDAPIEIEQIAFKQKPAIIARTENADSRHPQIAMLGHLDVVDAQDQSQFSIQLDGDKLYGRGTSDMKGPDAVMLHAIRDVARMNTSASLALVLTTDEEIGGAQMQSLIEDYNLRYDIGLVPDARNRPDEVAYENKGVFRTELRAEGEAMHNSRASNDVVKRVTMAHVEIMNAVEGDQFALPDGAWRSTVALGRLETDATETTTGSFATACSDIRFTREHTLDDVRAIVAAAAEKWDLQFEGASIEAESAFTPMDNPWMDHYGKCVQQVTNLELRGYQHPGGNDGRHGSVHGLPFIASRPVGGDIHQRHEWVSMKGLEDFYRIYLQFILHANEVQHS